MSFSIRSIAASLGAAEFGLGKSLLRGEVAFADRRPRADLSIDGIHPCARDSTP